MLRYTSLVCAVVALSGSTLSAQDIKYRIGSGSATTLPSSNVIALGTHTSDVTLHIFQDGTTGNTLPTVDLPAITITGSVSGGRLLVGITAEDDPPSDAVDPVDPVPRGVRNMSSISFSSDALRDATTLVAWIGNPSASDPADRGNVTGNISVGRIYVLDVPRDITGTLTATANDLNANPGFTSTDFAIQRIRVGNVLGGDVIAQGASGINGVTATASIGRIAVGPTSTAAITRDIKAEKGAIGSIYSAATIGTSATAKSKIWARNGIREIIAGGETGVPSPEQALDKNFFADIDASKGVTPTVGGNAYRIWTKGDYTGNINAWAVKAPASVSDSPTTGIIVGGTFNGSIKIVSDVFRGAIVADEFTGPIELGGLVGSIVARTGDIPRVSILAGTSGTGVFQATERNPVAAIGGFDPMAVDDLGLGDESRATQVPDYVIFARKIDTVEIGTMKIDGTNKRVPRVEVQTIGNLTIGGFDGGGLVWSGLRTTGPVAQTGQEFTKIDGTATFGCLTDQARIWLKAGASGTLTASVTNDSVGRLYVESLPARSVLRIGDRLMTPWDVANDSDRWGDVPSCWLADAAVGVGAAESSPRNESYRVDGTLGTTYAPPGLRFRTGASVAGQVVLNARATGRLLSGTSNQWVEAYWNGVVDTVNFGFTYSTATGTGLWAAPKYQTSSGSIGAGAVGLVPYRMHEEDSHPATSASGNPGVRGTPGAITAGNLRAGGESGAWVRFYGPVFTTQTGQANLLRVYWDTSATGAFPPAGEVTSSFEFTVGSTDMLDAAARKVYLSWVGDCRAPEGYYKVVRNGDMLRCGLLLAGTAPQSIADDSFIFRVTPIANACNPADIAESNGTPGADGCVNNGDFSLFFTEFYSADCSATCAVTPAVQCNPADIATPDGTPGFDGCVDNGDFSLFFSVFFNAVCPDCNACQSPGESLLGGGEGMMSSMARSASAAGLDPAVVEQRLNALRNLGRPVTPEDVRSAFPELLPGGGGGGGGGGSGSSDQ